MRTNSSVRHRVGLRLMRAMWLGLAAVHAPILTTLTAEVLTGAAGPDRIATWLGLLAVTAVFTVLACRGFVRCLGRPRRSVWLLCLATAIVHRGAIGLGPGEPMLPVAVVATTVVVGARLWRPGRRFLRKLRSALVVPMVLPLGGAVDRLAREKRRARRVRLAVAGGPRAPPRAAAPA